MNQQWWAIGVIGLVFSILLVAGWNAAPLTAIAADYNKEFLAGADFSGKDLTDASFTQATLREANFTGADLRGVSLFGAFLEKANLTSADLRGATLDRARLTRANLTNANLEGAFAFNANFKEAIIDGADFTDVQLRQDALDLLCEIAKGTNPTTHRQTRDTLNCF